MPSDDLPPSLRLLARPIDDIPAAHSMDTTWFAVDRDGHVAALDSLEAGALPNDLGTQGDELYALEPLPEIPSLIDDAGHRAHVRGTRGGDHAVVPDRPLGYFIVFLAADAQIDDFPHVHRVRATSGEALVILHEDGAMLDELHARHACRWCRHAWYVGDELEATRGLYVYRHITENWIAGPYARLYAPESARTLDELPDAVRETALRFDGRFADSPVLQPAEHWPCRAHGDLWLASDFETTRSFETGEIVDEDDD